MGDWSSDVCSSDLLDFTRVNGEHHLLYDSQRDYRRSSFGASPLPGEWIMRLLTPPAHP